MVFFGFYLLRVALWNHYGKEILTFTPESISYIADYGKFKDGLKHIENKQIHYSFKPIMHQGKKMGTLVIENDNERIESVILIDEQQLNEIIIQLKNNK